MQPLELLVTARRLAHVSEARQPTQADLKRAVSSAYYAVFHELCLNCANTLIGPSDIDRSDSAWGQVYRAVEHRIAKNQCENRRVMGKFPKDIEDFANAFVSLQIKRHSADYDPNSLFSLTDALTVTDEAEAVIRSFRRVSKKDRSAFSAWVLLKHRGG